MYRAQKEQKINNDRNKNWFDCQDILSENVTKEKTYSTICAWLALSRSFSEFGSGNPHPRLSLEK